MQDSADRTDVELSSFSPTSSGEDVTDLFAAYHAARARDVSKNLAGYVRIFGAGGLAALAGCVAAMLVGCAAMPGGDGDDAIDPTAFTSCPGESPAHENFNAYWKELDAKYAVFDLRLPAGKTWASIGAEACTHVRAGMPDAELFDTLLGMSRELDDGHTTLEGLGREEDGEVSVYPNYEVVYTLEDLVEANYLAGAYTRGADDEISWGKIGNVGYISITSMEDLSTAATEESDVAAARAAMQQATTDLASTTGLVIDIRANEGGWDGVSLEIASWVAGAKSLAWKKQVRASATDHDAYEPLYDEYVEAMQPGGYTKPVVVISSGGTYSAAETFQLAMRVREHVTMLGERGSGHLSDQIPFTLPNGWEVEYSGERYYAADGEIYEVAGIPVDVPMALDTVAIAAMKDPQLEAALARLR